MSTRPSQNNEEISMTNPEVIKTKVGIVGGGPAGLMLSHLLSKAGIDNVVVEKRDHETIRTTHRAGILEHGSVSMLVDSGVSDRVLKAGYKHEGIDLRFGGVSHRIDFEELVGESVWLYPQNEVFVDRSSPATRATPCRRPARRVSTWRSPTSGCSSRASTPGRPPGPATCS